MDVQERFLYRWKNEVSVMLLTEFDQKSYDNSLIKVGVEKGKEEERKKIYAICLH